MFQIKICGITSAADAKVAADAGADAIGLNFYEGSSRYVDVDLAAVIGRSVPESVLRVGVFVNADAAKIRQTVEQAGLSCVQLHGDEPPGHIAELGSIPTIRAFRCSEANTDACLAYLESCARAGRLPDTVLIDSYEPARFGGTGLRVNVAILAEFRQQWPEIPLILAGGLTPENVAEAIRQGRPNGVDTASGVEKSPGKKVPERVAAFVRCAREAFQALS